MSQANHPSDAFPSWLDDAQIRVMKLAVRRGYKWDFGDVPEHATVVTGVRGRAGARPFEDNIYLDRKNPNKSYAGRYALGEGIRGVELFGGGDAEPQQFTSGPIIDVIEAMLGWDQQEGSDGPDHE